jgi:hypothetical protein
MNDQAERCLCGHPKIEGSTRPEPASDTTIMRRLEEIRQRRAALCRELGTLTVEEERLRSELTHWLHTPSI